MHPARLPASLRPCPVCGNEVDTLRAGQVLCLPDGFRYLCDRECRRRFGDGERFQITRGGRSGDRTVRSTGDTRKRRTGRVVLDAAEFDLPARLPQPFVRRAVTAVVALFCALVPDSGIATIIAAVLVFGVVGADVLSAERPAGKAPQLGWWLGPAGVCLLALGGLLSAFSDQPSQAYLVAACMGAGVLPARGWIELLATRIAGESLQVLREALPARSQATLHSSGADGDGEPKTVSADSVRTSEEVSVSEGGVCPVDGVVVGGTALVLPHPTARSPVSRSHGEPVLAGARVIEGALQIVATHVADDRAMMSAARIGEPDSREPSGATMLVHRVSALAPFVVIGVAGIAAIVQTNGASGSALAVAGALLVAAPLRSLSKVAHRPMLIAASAALQRGIVFLTGEDLNRLGKVGVVALCGRGVVTSGEPEVVDVTTVGDESSLPLIALAASAQRAAGAHGIARGILSYAEAQGAPDLSVRRATWIPGQGVTAVTPSGEIFVLGNRQLLLKEGVSIAYADHIAEAHEARGRTVLFMGIGGRVRAIVALHDALRTGARAAVQRLFDLQVEPVLISGDHRRTIEALAQHLEVGHVKAELLPEERGAEVARLSTAGSGVAAVGYLPRDELALGASSVRVMLGAAGAPGADSGVALTSTDVRDAAAGLWIARACRDVIQRGLGVVLFGGGLLLGLGMAGLIAPWVVVVFGAVIDAVVQPSSIALQRRIELRVPRHS